MHIPGFLSGVIQHAETTCIYILAFAIVFGVLAFAHEFGHFIAAKMLGMSVDQFGIGFPPTYGWTLLRRSGTSYTVHPVPLGAFVKIRGMDPGDQDAPNSFLRQPPWARLIVLVAGSAANMMLAVLIFIVMAMSTGLPTPYVTNRVDEVESGSAAERAGMLPGDTVLAVRPAEGQSPWTYPVPVPGRPANALGLVALIHGSWTLQKVNGESVPTGKPLVVQLQHANGTRVTEVATPGVRPDGRGGYVAGLGYVPGTASLNPHYDCIRAVGKGIDEAAGNASFLVDTLKGYVSQVAHRTMTPGQLGDKFGGPVMIAQASGKFVHEGSRAFLGFMGMLSINLAVLNLLPLPIFDGGQIILVLIEVVRRRQLEPAQFIVVQLVGLALIGSLFCYLTIHDIMRFHQSVAMP